MSLCIISSLNPFQECILNRDTKDTTNIIHDTCTWFVSISVSMSWTCDVVSSVYLNLDVCTLLPVSSIDHVTLRFMICSSNRTRYWPPPTRIRSTTTFMTGSSTYMTVSSTCMTESSTCMTDTPTWMSDPLTGITCPPTSITGLPTCFIWLAHPPVWLARTPVWLTHPHVWLV